MYIYIYKCIYVYVCIYIYLYVCMYVCKYVCIYIYAYIHIDIYLISHHSKLGNPSKCGPFLDIFGMIPNINFSIVRGDAVSALLICTLAATPETNNDGCSYSIGKPSFISSINGQFFIANCYTPRW